MQQVDNISPIDFSGMWWNETWYLSAIIINLFRKISAEISAVEEPSFHKFLLSSDLPYQPIHMV